MIHRLAAACAAIFLLAVGSATARAQDLDLLLTRAERTEFMETTSYAEVVELAHRVDEASPLIHLTTFGYTSEGRPLPLLVVGAADASPASVKATGKLRVYLQGDIHAGEVCGKEALLMLLRRFAGGEYPSWTDSLVLLVAPIYNADGNERVSLTHRPRQHGPLGGMGQRPNAQGLDLNRDHMKLDSPEARSFVRMLNTYDPHVTVDLHTTDGTRHGYYLTYSPPLHPNTPPAIDDLLRGRWLPEVTRRVKEKRGWDFYYYGNAFEGPMGMGWYTFDHRPRFNNNYVGLRNRVAILSEAYAYATFQDRVRATLWFVEEVLDYAHQHASAIREVVADADAAPVVGRDLAVRATFRGASRPSTILMGEVDEEVNPFTGRTILRRRDVTVPTPMREFGAFEASETETAPSAYYVLPEAAEAIERLEAHGIVVVRYADAREVPADHFVMDSTSVAERSFQGHHERTVWGAWVPTMVSLPAGAAYVSVDQPLGRLAFQLLEPRSDDGLLAWGFFDEQIEAGAVPVYRVPAGR